MNHATPDAALRELVRLQRLHPELRPLDWVMLGTVAEAGPKGLPLAYVRANPGFICTLTAFLPSMQRLCEAGYVERRTDTYMATMYGGRAGRKPRQEVIFCRTAKPLTEAEAAPPRSDAPHPLYVL